MAKGMFIGNSHANGGIPSEIAETGTKIEIEGNEYYICNEAYNSPNYFDFKKKTNKEILDFIYTEFACKLNQDIMHSGDFIVCKVVVADNRKKDRKGTIKQILNEMQGEKNCKVETGSDYLKEGGELIKRADGSYSKRGLWDNIRANIGSGRKPTKEMLKQEAIITEKYHLGGDMSKHLAPNGKPSNLTHEQWHLVRTPEFKKFFGDWENDPKNASKVIDENGEPLVCYHGSNKKIDSFRADENQYVYFTNDINLADTYAIHRSKKSNGEKFIYDTYLNIINPLIIDANFESWDNISTKSIENSDIAIKDLLKRGVDTITTNSAPKIAIKNGFDGVIVSNIYDGVGYGKDAKLSNVYVALHPNQIKLADGTNTKFDSNNPDIRYEQGNLITPKEMEKHTYALTLRPFDIGTYPKQDFVRFVEEEADNYKFGLLEYSKTLSIEDIKHYSLAPVSDLIKYDGKEFYYYEDLKAKAEILKNPYNIPYVKVTEFDENNEVVDETELWGEDFLKNIEDGSYRIIEDKKESEKSIIGNVFGDLVLDRLEKAYKQRFPNDKFEREAIIKSWNETKNERDENRANNNLQNTLMSYFDDDLKPIIYSDIVKEAQELEKGIKVEQEHKDTLEKVASGEISVDEAIKETAEEHIAENPNYYDELEKIEKKPNSKEMQTEMIEEIKTDIESYKNPYQINKAIERLLDQKGDSDNYSAKELEFISYYSGYGGLEKFGEIGVERMKGLMYEFYTPDAVVKKMWALAYKYGYGTIADNSVFEPSVGIGAFLKYAPKDVRLVANEINEYSAKICEILYPNAKVELKYFEQNFIKNNLSIKHKTENLDQYSLIIGNPPYGTLNSKYVAMGEDKFTRAANYTEYFISRGLDLLVKDGLLVYIVGAEQYNGGSLFLDSGLSKVKEIIFDKADLLDAYRLPINIFERTGVSSEIVVFKKR